jgi:hypothetical protein
MATSWCDKLASVPTAGVKLDPHFSSSDSLFDSLSTVLDPLYTEDKVRFQVTQQQSFDISFTTEDGFMYAADPTKFSVAFRHRMRARQVSGGPPVMEMLSRPLPYTQLLTEVIKRAVDGVVLTPSSKERMVRRVGIVSTTWVAEEEMPPGIDRFIKYMGRPWGGPVDTYNISLCVDLGKGKGTADRCVHTVIKTEDREQLISMNFDWQRMYPAGQPVRKEVLYEVMGEAEKAALKYFEDLAEGRRFDEKIIRESVGEPSTV